jgi:hypothetical protein
MSSASDCTYETVPRPSIGAYEAVMTIVKDGNGAEMYFVTRLAYGVPIPEGQTLDELSEARARERVAELDFQAGLEECWMYKPFGWEQCEP